MIGVARVTAGHQCHRKHMDSRQIQELSWQCVQMAWRILPHGSANLGIIRRRGMKREQRLQAACEWISKYTGKDIVRGYRRWFGVDKVCALLELKMCGLPISDEGIAAARKDQERLSIERQEQGNLRALQSGIDQDDNFACIIGYTSGGAPYGLTWEKLDRIEQEIEEQIGPTS